MSFVTIISNTGRRVKVSGRKDPNILYDICYLINKSVNNINILRFTKILLQYTNMVTSSKRFKSFLFGIIFASATWAVSLYLYWKLTQDSNNYVTTKKPWLPTKIISNDVLLPYEDNDKNRERSKSKYYSPYKYKNSEALINQLQPKLVKPKSEAFVQEGK